LLPLALADRCGVPAAAPALDWSLLAPAAQHCDERALAHNLRGELFFNAAALDPADVFAAS
jgi:hypothetical protein